MFNIKYKGVGNSFDYKPDFLINQPTPEEDILNKEWEKILNEVEEQCAKEVKAGTEQPMNKNEIVTAARK